MPTPKPFRVLTEEEFDSLTTQEKAEYLRQAVEAQQRVLDEFQKYVEKLRESKP